MRLFAVVLLAMAACSGHKDDTPQQKPSTPITFAPTDAGPPGPVGVVEPSGSNAVDIRPVPPDPSGSRERRPIDVTLRSTPTGALVAVDGTAVGVTPAFWAGYADGREHEFVFTLEKFEIARYRFVPVTSGVIHARLVPLAEERDAGVAPPPEVVPVQPLPPAPPPPVPPVTPADAAMAGSGSSAPGSGGAVAGSGSAARGPQP